MGWCDLYVDIAFLPDFQNRSSMVQQVLLDGILYNYLKTFIFLLTSRRGENIFQNTSRPYATLLAFV
jgi:hypothetical protein